MGYIDDLRKEYQELTKQKAQENTKYNVPTSLINQYKNEYAQLTGQTQQPVQPTISQPNFANHASMSQQGHNNIAQKQANIAIANQTMTNYLNNGGKIDINDTNSLARLAAEQGVPSQQIAQAAQNINNQGIGGIANRIGAEIKNNNLFDDVNTAKYFEYENKLEDAKARGNAVDTAVYQNLIDRMDEDYKPKTKNWYSGKQNLQEHEQNIGTTIDILKYYEDKVLNAKTPEEVQEYLPKYQQEYKNYQNAVSRYQDAKLYNKYNGNPVLDELDILGYTGANTLSGILDETIENVHNDSEVLRGKSFDYIKPSELIKENNARKSGTIPANLQRLSLSMNALREQATRENATDDLKNLYEQIMNGKYTGTEEDIQRVLDNARDEKYKLEAKENVNTKLRQKKEEFDYNYQPSPAMKYVLENGLEQVIGMTPIYAANLVSPFLGDVTMYQSAANSAYDRARENGATASQARANKTLSGLAEAGFEHLVQSSIDAGFERGGLLKPTEWAENIANPLIRTGVGVGVDVTGEGLEEVASEVTQPIIDRITYDPNANMATVEEVWGAFTGSILPTLIMQGAGYTLQKVDTFVNKAKSNINNSNLTELQKAELINQVENGRKEILKQIEQRKQEIDTQAKQTNQNNQIARDTEALNLQPQQTSAETMQRNVENSAQNKTIAEKVKDLNKLGYNIPQSTANTLQAIQDVRGTRIEFDNTIDGNGVYDAKNRIVYLNPNSTRAIEFTIAHELGHDIKAGDLEDYNKLQKAVLDYAGKQQGYTEGMEALDNTYRSKLGEGNYVIEDEMTNDILGEVLGNQEFLDSLAQEQPNLFQKVWNWIKNVLIDNTNGRLSFNERRLLNKYEQGFRNAYQKAFNGTQQEGLQHSIGGEVGLQNAINNDTRFTKLENNLNKAQTMAQNGIDNETIRQQTNWFQDKNEDWKFEFSDKDMNLKPNITLGENKTYKLGDILEHDLLFTIYPELADYNVNFEKMDKNGSFNKKSKKIRINNKLLSSNNIQGTLIHEIQHAIQEIEGFEGGRSSKGSKLAYYNSLGEIEAFDTKNRYIEERNGNLDRDLIPPESSKSNPKHPKLDNYLQNRTLSDKIKDGIFKYLKDRGVVNDSMVEENNIKNTREDYGLVDGRKYLENSEKGSFSMPKNTQYSLSEAPTQDNQGRQLSEGQQEYFKDSKVRDENGSLVVLYHGTPNGGFNTFDINFRGSTTDTASLGDYGKGFYFTPNKQMAERYSENDTHNKGNKQVYEVYLNMKNPLRLDLLNQISKDGLELIKKYGWQNTTDEMYDEIYAKNGLTREEFEKMDEAYTMLGDNWQDIELSELGFDGVINENKNEYVVFNSNQIKNVDNLNPTDNEDIRYSKQNNTWQQFLDDTYGKWNTGTRTNFTKTDTTMLPSNEELQEQESKGINAILKDLKIPTNEELQKTERESVKKEPIVQANKITSTKRLDDVRDFKKVGDRKVNAYQYDNPEVKPFFQQEAKNMLYDLNNVIKGERTATWDDYGELHYSGVTRETVQDIADLLDGKNGVKLSYADIEKGLNAIIEDKGSENIAAAKRIEMVLDKRLREGYTDSYGTEYEPNDNYLNFLAGKDFIDPAEYDKQVQDKLISDYEAQNDDGTLFSLSEEEAKEVSDYVDKIYEDNTLDEDFRNKIIQEINKLANYDVFKDIKQEVKEYKEKNYGSISEPTQPKPKTVKWTETAQKNELVRENVEEQKITYVPSSNKQQLAHANKQLEQMGYDDAKKFLDNKVRYNERITPTDIALGERLIQEAIKKGDINQAQELIADTAILGKDYGQVIQALSMISRMTPEGQLMYINKVVDRLNDKIDTKNEKRSENKKANNIEIDKELAGNILKATNEVELQNAVDAVLQNIADQMEVSLPDKIAEWRYLAMLANPRTHIRNSVANVGMKGLYGAKNQIQRAIETVAAPLLDERTRTYKKATADVKKFAEQSTKDLADILGGNDNKTIESRIKEMRKVFKNESLEKIRRFNSNMLSLEDNVFTQAAYKANLQEYLTANGIKTQHDIDMNPEIVQKGINFAKEEAWKTTFHQMSKAATAINRFENINGYTKLFAGGVIPFKKTPINIAKTGAAYSPLGLLDTLSTQTYKLKSGQITANQYIDRLSQGLTGSALFGIGALLAKMGILRAGTDKDDEYAEQIGQTKSYSVRLGDKNYDISWFAPSAMPLLMGAELVETTEGKEVTFSDIAETLASTINPLSEMSFVSGLNSSIRSYSSSDSPVDAIGAFGKNAAKSYFGQFVPTIGGQINKIIDKTERSTTATKDSPWKEGESFARQQINKIPGGSFLLEPKTDVWGNEKKRDSNVAVRAFDALINPGTVTKDQTTRVDKEIMELAKEADDTSIKPSIPKSYFTYNKEDVNLSAKDYTKYKKIYGQYMYNTYDALLDDEYYKSLEPAEKVKVLKNIATDSRNIAKNEVGYQTNEYFKYDAITDELEKNGIPLVDYYLIGRDIKMSDSKTKKKTAIAQTSESMNSKDKDRITSQDKKVLWDIFGIN